MKEIKTINALVKELVKREGLKKQVEIGQVREIVGHMCDIYKEQFGIQPWGLAPLLVENAVKRSERKPKTK